MMNAQDEKPGRPRIDARLKDLPRDVLLGIIGHIHEQYYIADVDDLIRKGKQTVLFWKADQKWAEYERLRSEMDSVEKGTGYWLELSSKSFAVADLSDKYSKQADALWKVER